MSNKVFIFPLPKLSLQLGTQKPLNIFEPRYLEMIKDSVKHSVPVALAYGLLPSDDIEPGDNEESVAIQHEAFNRVKSTVCMGVPKIIQECKDGTMVIMLPGSKRGKLTKVDKTGLSYLVGEFEELENKNELRAENILLLRRIKTKLEKWVSKMVKLDCQKDLLSPCMSDASRIIGLYVELMIECPETKQHLLEIDDVNDKLQYLIFNC